MNTTDSTRATDVHGLSAQLRDIANASADRTQRLAATAAQSHIDAEARALPDDMFHGDPEIARLTLDAVAKSDRANHLLHGPSRLARVSGAVNRLSAMLTQAKEEMRLAALDDVLDGDYEFSKGSDVARRIEALRWQMDSAQLAQEVLAKSPPEMREFPEAAQEAQRKLRTALFDRKKLHVRACPQLQDATVLASA